MALVEGINMRIEVAGKQIFHEVSAGLDAVTDFKETASKDTGGKKSTPGAQSWNIPIEALYENDGTVKEDPYTLGLIWKNKTLVAITLTTGVVGDVIYSGNAYIENFGLQAQNEEVVTYSWSFKGDGELNIARVAA